MDKTDITRDGRDFIPRLIYGWTTKICFWKSRDMSFFPPLYISSSESISSTVQTNVSLDIQIKNDDLAIPSNLLFRQDILAKYPNATPIYTDGSRTNNPERVGSAYYCPSLQIVRNFRISDRSSIFSAKLVAILQSLSILDREEVNAVVIFTDSLSSVTSMGLQSCSQKVNPLVRKIKEKVHELKNTGKKTSIVWIPVDMRIFGNEFADRAANHARSLETSDSYQNCEWEELSLYFKQTLINSTNSFISEAIRTKGTTFCNLLGPFRAKAWFQSNPTIAKNISL